MPEESALPIAENSVPTETAEGQAQPVPDEKEASPQVDPRFAGKKPEELIAIIQEQDKFAGKLANEAVGRVKSLEERLDRTLAALESRQIESAEVPVAKEEEKPTFDFFADPEGSVNRLLEARLARERKEQAKREGKAWAEDAKSKFEFAKRQAYTEDKRLYEGIEGDVERAIFTGLRAGTITKEVAGDPSTWRAVGRHIRSERGEFDRIVPQKRQPMAGPVSDTPSGMRRLSTDDDDIVFDEETREEMKRWNIDTKKAGEAIRIGQQMKRRGELK